MCSRPLSAVSWSTLSMLPAPILPLARWSAWMRVSNESDFCHSDRRSICPGLQGNVGLVPGSRPGISDCHISGMGVKLNVADHLPSGGLLVGKPT